MSDRASVLRESLSRVQQAIKDRATQVNRPVPRLVAVSKFKPAEDIAFLHEAGHRHFGENYVQELEAKVKVLPQDIQWHFIGGLQSNKCKILASIPNLWAVETVESSKQASLLSKHRSPDVPKLNVYLQVNVSGEDVKSGVKPITDTSESELLSLARFVLKECPNLCLKGLMTIGSLDQSTSNEDINPEFAALAKSRDVLLEALNLPELELSMGMSTDFLQAIPLGSTNVRIGSDIFGARPPQNPNLHKA